MTGWSAAPPLDDNRQPYFLRGAKIPDLAGLVRPCEIARGRINHALAFAYPGTTSNRLQLDPSIGAETIKRRWDCTGPCLTIAIMEYDATANWKGVVMASTLSAIPVERLRIVPPARRTVRP